MWWLTSAFRNPIGLVLTGAVLALCLSSYPIIFFGKSYVSPGYGPQLLYDELPFVPGYLSTDTEHLDADAGAMPWQNLPYARVQHEAVFTHGEFPFWNRYNSAGLPLFGQGQSQILDPLHWIVVASEGNGWAWDVKFLLSKLIFLAGIGASILFMTRSPLVSIVVMVSTSFIGFFYFRFNHPIFFNLTYSSWLFFSYLHLVQDIRLSSKRKVGWRVWPVLGVFVTSLLLLFGGTPKEGVILFGALHFAGFIGVVATSRGFRNLSGRIAVLLVLWVAIALVSAPHWLIFLDSLAVLTTSYSSPQCNFAEGLVSFIDTSFLGPRDRPWSQANINTFIFVAALQTVVSTRRHLRRPDFWMTLLPLAGLLAFAFGVVPNSICQNIPLISQIHHVNDTFFTAAIPFAVIFCSLGLNEFLADIRLGTGRLRWTAFLLIVALLLAWLAYDRRYNSLEVMASAAGMLTAFSLGGVIVLLFLSVWLYRIDRDNSSKTLSLMGLAFVLSHAYHGLHLSTGWGALDDLLINPTPRADFLKRSPAVDSLGYLLPSEIFETIRYKVGSTDICGISASNLAFEGYVNKYPDLFAAYNANPADKSKSEWGRSHYCKFGSNEGRTYPGQVEQIVVEATLDRAVKAGGVESEIQRYKSLLRERISSSPGPLIMQTHAANFLREVGARRWLDNPARVIGEGRTPMSGFYSYLKLESLNGPDALMRKNYLQFLDLMGWRLPPRETWHRTMGIEDFEKLEPLLDVLNVGYLMSWKRNLNTVHVVSEYTPYSDDEQIIGEQDLAGKELWLSLRRIPVIADRVGCRSKGLQSDGRPDSVFVADINLPNLGPGKLGTISALRLERIRPLRVDQTGGSDSVLGVSKGINAPLLNHSNGSVQISEPRSNLRLWLFSCADGHDQPASEYRVRMDYKRATQLPLVFDGDMKIWEREHPWPRAFFVDEIASYTDRDPYLAQAIVNAAGLPFAAVYGNDTVWPSKKRTVVKATDYQLTSNSTSFRVKAPTAGIVVLTETNIPGDIHVAINGEPGEVITVNHAFRGVKLSETGLYDIRFFYRPRLWYLAWILSGSGSILFVFILLSCLILNKRRTHKVGFEI